MTAVAARASTTTRPAAPSAAASTKDIWAQIIAEKLTNPAASSSTVLPAAAQREASLLFVGPHASGKSTLIQSYMFKGREETPKPTTALEYRYTRTSMKEQLNEEKSISHFWELGGGSTLHELCNVVLVERSVADCLVVITLDCARVGALVDDAKRYVELVRKKGEQLLAQMKANGSQVPSALQAAQRKRFGESHPDLGKVHLMPVQTLIVAHKYDAIQSQGPEDLRVLTRALRAIAHQNGCSLMFTSNQHKEHLNKTFRTRISHHLLGVEKRGTAQLNHIELVSVPVGGDSFAQIGSADGSTDEGSVAVVEGWRKLCSQYFPRKPADAEVVVNLDELKLSAEPLIDQLVAQKDEELKKKKRELDLARKMQAADSSAKRK